MFNLYENIESLCRKHGTSPTQICLKAGLGRAALSNLKNGRCKTMEVDSLQKIADALGEPFDVVAHGERGVENAELLDYLEKKLGEIKKTAEQDHSLNQDERYLLDAYRTMTDEQKQMMNVFIRGLKND